MQPSGGRRKRRSACLSTFCFHAHTVLSMVFATRSQARYYGDSLTGISHNGVNVMADIYLLIEGSRAGPYTEEQIRQSLEEGKITTASSAWREGLSDWVPLSTILPGRTSHVPPPIPTAASRPSYCQSCGTENKNGASFCSNCGTKLGEAGSRPRTANLGWKRQAENVFENISDRIISVAGVEKLEGLDGKEFLSGVLKKRTDDDIEELFITGTKSTTPPLSQVDTRWPKPWAFFKAMITSLIVFGGFYYGSVQFDNANMIPGAILVGSFAIPFSALVFFIEMNVARNISIYQVMKLVFMGGVGALLITLFLDSMVTAPTTSNGNLTWGGAMITGAVEEAAKVLAVIWFMGKRRFRWSLNGLLIGAAIGTGFSAFESAGYALQSLLTNFKPQEMMQEIEMRALLAPGGHVVWAALATAALWKVKGQEAFRWDMLKDPRFLRVFFFVASLHAIWDAPVGIPFFGDEDGQTAKDLLLGIIAWIAVFGYIQDGLKQIRKAQSAANPADEASPASASKAAVA